MNMIGSLNCDGSSNVDTALRCYRRRRERNKYRGEIGMDGMEEEKRKRVRVSE
jgi:hypothetical protein